MKLRNLLSDNLAIGPCVLGIGTFDGVHIGHRKLIEEIISSAKAKGLKSVILTFDHSPKKFLYPETFKGYLTTPEEKFSFLLSTGIDAVVFRPFDKEFSKLPYQKFIHEIVLEKLKAEETFIGFNFCFGANKSGNAQILKQELEQAGKSCNIIEPVKVNDKIVSSSIIRDAVAIGDFETSNTLLGRETCFSGEVVHGDHRGRTMGFPTANLQLEESQKIIPPNGVYICYADTPQGSYPALVNIGIRPTFAKKTPILEAHLIGFTGDLYHHTIRVRFFKRIRDEKKFPGIESLIEQIKQDMTQVKQFFAS